MDVTITQASLHHVLRLAARAVPAHATLPILQHFLLEAGPNGLTVSATDTEVAVVTTAPAEVAKPGRAAVAARLLDDYVGHLPAEPVRLSLAPDRPRLEVRCRPYSAGFATADADDFPTLLPADGGVALALDARRLRDALQRVAFAAARDEQRPVLASVLVRSTSAAGDEEYLVGGTWSDGAPESPFPAATTAHREDQLVAPGHFWQQVSADAVGHSPDANGSGHHTERAQDALAPVGAPTPVARVMSLDDLARLVQQPRRRVRPVPVGQLTLFEADTAA